jgi:hypothetical protein
VSAIYPVSKQTFQRILPKHGLAWLSIGLWRQIQSQLAVDEYVVGHEENCPQGAPVDDGLATLPMNADVPWDRRSSDFFEHLGSRRRSKTQPPLASECGRRRDVLCSETPPGWRPRRYFTSWSTPPW